MQVSYDTIKLCLPNNRAPGVDFLEETSCYLGNDIAEVRRPFYHAINGKVGNLNVKINRSRVVIENSLPKYFLGNNLQSMTLADTRQAIEQLSDTLHLPISNAEVKRVDVAANIELDYPPEIYLSHLGELPRYTRAEQGKTGIRYEQTRRKIVFYDKIKESKKARENIPEEFVSTNLLRYELRYITGVPREFHVSELTAKDLCNSRFYSQLVDRWQQRYREIRKVNDVTLNFEEMSNDFSKMEKIALINSVGGLDNLLQIIKDAQEKGLLTRKQAYDARKRYSLAITRLTTKDKAVEELDTKVNAIVRESLKSAS